MSWVGDDAHLDADTVRLLEITHHFLIAYFHHDCNEADRLMSEFLSASRYDEDFMHHESSFRLAAIIHYIHALGGDPSSVGTWLIDQGYNITPRDALEYFREHYFRKP